MLEHVIHVIGWILAGFLFCLILTVSNYPHMKEQDKWCWGILLTCILYLIAVTLIRW